MKKENIYLSTIGSDCLEVAKKYNLGIELAQFCTAAYLDDDSLVKAEVGAALAQTNSIILHGPFNELTPCAIDPKVLEITKLRYRQAFAKAQEVRAKKLVLHAGFFPMTYYPIWFIEKSIEFWKDMAKEIPSGLTVCLENVMEPYPEMLLNIVSHVNSPSLKLCLDIGHCNTRVSNVPPEKWVEVLTPYISHIHLHNNEGDGDLHAPLYSGEIDMEQMVHLLGKCAPDATITLELRECASSVEWLSEKGFL